MMSGTSRESGGNDQEVDLPGIGMGQVMTRWIRPPIGNKTCPCTGLRHAKFYAQFVGNPRIRQCRLGTGKTRGTRLVFLPDVLAELDRLAKEQGTSGYNHARG